MRRFVAVVAVLAVLVVPVAGFSAASAAEGFASECAAPVDDGEPMAVVIGQVACQRIQSEMVGGVTAFGYYVPTGCVEGGCPVLYLEHGTGGSYRTLVGSAGNPHPFVRALTAGPPVDTRTHPQPWRYADPDTWEVKPALDVIIVTPHNATVPSGHGPEAGIDGLWSDWNPRYAQGGDSELYPTPPPRFASHVIEELIPFVEEHLPAASGRQSRATNGRSQGGFGAFKLGLEYPDMFASMGSVSGGSIPPGNLAMLPDSPVGITGVPGAPYVRLPGVAPRVGGSTGEAFTTAVVGGMLLGWGDPAADTVYFRAAQPSVIATNGRSFSPQGQAQHILHSNNDAVPRRVEDFTSDRYHYDEFYEIATLAGGLDTVLALDAAEVEHHHEINPGLHSNVYANPHLRRFLEAQYAHLRHRDGGGEPPPWPTIFDYRTIRTEFTVWDWHVAVDREPVEFLNLRDVTCNRVTLQGTGSVTLTVPSMCRTGLDGARSFTIELGPPMPTDEVGGGSTPLPAYGRTVTVELTPLRPCPPPRCNFDMRTRDHSQPLPATGGGAGALAILALLGAGTSLP